MTIAVGAVAGVAATGQETDKKQERGEQILTASCLTCHDHRPVDTHVFDEEGWTKEVKSMIEKGAEVKADDVPVLVEYLTRFHGPLPEGPGRDVLLNICTQCHDTQRIRRTRLSPEGWAEILENMLNEGAPLNQKDFAEVLRYLARNFRP
jgi:hypothetical protein